MSPVSGEAADTCDVQVTTTDLQNCMKDNGFTHHAKPTPEQRTAFCQCKQAAAKAHPPTFDFSKLKPSQMK